MLAAGTAAASNFSFTGTFTTDDQLAEIPFSLATLQTITAVTYSYAGGINQAGTSIPEGGFDPYLAIFDSSGNLVQVDDNNDLNPCGNVPLDPVTGGCFDSYISESLSPGNYLLILSQSYNSPANNTLADGYTQTGNSNFTSNYFCTNGIFCDATTANRTGNWAVDLDNVTMAGSTVPEPATLPLLVAALGVILIWRRRSAV